VRGWKKTGFGRKLRKLRKLKRLFDIGWLLADMPGLRYSPVKKNLRNSWIRIISAISYMEVAS
jgi:hypothetical protein